MQRRTRISLRGLLALVAYFALLLFLIIPDNHAQPFSQPLAWMYDYGREIPKEPAAWPQLVAGAMLLIGTTPPFFHLRWWTIVPAIVCGTLYVGIGFAEAIHQT